MSLTHWPNLHAEAFRGVGACVTGGAGFIGSHLVEALVRLGAKVSVIDDLSGGDEANFDGFRAEAGDRLRFIKASILDAEALERAVAGCALVFHQAALGSVPGSIDQPQRYHDVNVTGTLNVLQASVRAGVRRVMFAASAAAYGDSEELPKREAMPTLPKSPYAANKVAGEAMLRAWAASYPIDTAALRYFNIYGPRQNANSAYAAVIAAFAKALLQNKAPTIFGDGLQSRDFCFVENVVHANLLAARASAPLRGEIFNIACGERISVNELASKMARMMGRPQLVATHGPERAGDVKHSQADIACAQRTLGYRPVVDFDPGLQATVDWYARA